MDWEAKHVSSVPEEAGWEFSKPGSPHFVGQLLAGMIMLALWKTHVTHRCCRGQ